MNEDTLIEDLAALARKKIDRLPDDYTVKAFKNGNFLGKFPEGSFRSNDRQWVEDMLWIAAAGRA